MEVSHHGSDVNPASSVNTHSVEQAANLRQTLFEALGDEEPRILSPESTCRYVSKAGKTGANELLGIGQDVAFLGDHVP